MAPTSDITQLHHTDDSIAQMIDHVHPSLAANMIVSILTFKVNKYVTLSRRIILVVEHPQQVAHGDRAEVTSSLQ